MINLEIDGKPIRVEEGTSIIEAADELGIYIPRFCYHKKLSIAANCRMCLVEVEKTGKPLPACATPVTPGMKVFTASLKAVEAQRAVMEYLLINHPLDCPICDQGGECELQDLAMGFGAADSEYDEAKRAVFSENIGPLIETEMTRCIQCTRCVRFGDEIAGMRELGVINRGENEAIATYIKHMMRSELSGNIIDLCPVGALTDKPARYQGRGWEYREHPSISPHDCVGSHLFIHSRGQEYAPQRRVMRVVPREHDEINETWISDRDRFGHFGLYHESRVYLPRLKKNGEWEEISWDQALQEVSTRMQAHFCKNFSGEVAGLASPSSTLEELYVFQKLIRELGSPHVDHRVRWHDFSDQELMPAYPGMQIALSEIEKLNHIILIGSNVREEQPIIAHRIHQAFLEGAVVTAINPMDYDFQFTTHQIILDPMHIPHFLAEVVCALSDNVPESFASVVPSEEAITVANRLKSCKKNGIFLGAHALCHPNASDIRALSQAITRACEASVNVLTEGANSAGAWLAGVLPHRGPANSSVEIKGDDAKALLSNRPKKIYFLLNLEPEYDCAYSYDALITLKQADCVICLTPFVTEAMKEYAHVILPIAPFTETGGTYVNAEGRWQSFQPVTIPYGESQPAWKVLSVLGRFLSLKNVTYEKVQDIQHELKKRVDDMPHSWKQYPLKPLVSGDHSVMRLAPWPMFRTDALVRNSKPLQDTQQNTYSYVRMNSTTANKWNLSQLEAVTVAQENSTMTLPLVIDSRLADNAVYLASGLSETAGFGTAEAPIVLKEPE